MRNYLDSKPTRVQPSSPIHPVTLGLILAVVALVLLLLDQIGVLAPARGRIEQALAPVAGALSGVRDHGRQLWSDVGTAPQLRVTAEALRQEVSTLRATMVVLQQEQVENNTLRQQLVIKEGQPWASRMVAAEVIVRTPDAVRRTIMISTGSADGVRVGMPVIGQQGSAPPALVGVVEEVGPSTANVLLITDFGSQISARVLHGDASATGVVQGQWQEGSRLRLEQVAHDASISAGDTVITAGLTRQLGVDLPLHFIPAGIPIGTVESSGADGHTLMAELRPFVDPDQVRSVWVIVSEGQ